MYEDLDSMEPTAPRDPNTETANTEDFVGGVQTFDDYLLQQLALLDLTDDAAKAGRAVIGSLDSDGFFTGSLDEIAAMAGVSLEDAEAGLRAVQQLDPPGVGARDLTEALCLQMESLGIEEPYLLRMVRDHLDDIAASHYRKVARALRVDEDEVRRLVEILRALNPRPAGAFSPGPSPGYIVPDVTLRRFGDEWLITPNSDALPTLRVSPRYRSMLRSGSTADDETRRYLKDKIRSAESFIKNVDRRKDTVTRITEIIMEVQGDFFEDGKGPLRPLRLEDVAVEIGVHLSTVSRGVTGKYMATPYGLFELKHFFSGGYRTAQGMDVAATSIKQRLRELVREEDPAKPVSDQRLAELLSDEGVTVARRTVAKYREELSIEPSWARRQR
jgi:RNA polymerase sigma-54 factor